MAKFTLNDVRAEYRRLDAKFGVHIANIDLSISKRSVNRFGFCRYRGRKPVQISLADFIFEDKVLFYDVIRHEYAHALVKVREPYKNHGHDAVWKMAALECGCSPTRLNDNEYGHKISAKRRDAQTKYIVQCNACGQIWKCVRTGNVVKSLQKGSKSCYCPCGSHDLSLFDLSQN